MGDMNNLLICSMHKNGSMIFYVYFGFCVKFLYYVDFVDKYLLKYTVEIFEKT